MPISEKNDFPFIYIYHGKPIDIYSFQGEKYFIFFFKENITQQTVDKIEKIAPGIISGSTSWTGNMYMSFSITEEDEITGYYLKKRKSGYDVEFDDELFTGLYTDFANDIESWVLSVNKIAPVDFFIGHYRIAGSKWDKYSDTKLPGVIDKLSAYTEGANDRVKRIINEAVMQLKQGKNHKLTAESKKQLTELIKSTE
ncbi:MAG: hypothetical protein HOP31_02755 [Ignavibacteria bacterium]|nr:hypothetical protein [Ignavibacteria bacterium]